MNPGRRFPGDLGPNDPRSPKKAPQAASSESQGQRQGQGQSSGITGEEKVGEALKAGDEDGGSQAGQWARDVDASIRDLW